MRIVFVLTCLGVGGAERQALAVAERMRARGHTVALMTLRPELAEEWPTEIQTIRLDMLRTPLSLVRGLAQAREFLREFRPDLVHSHTFHANIFARLLKVLAPALVLISTIHNVYEGGRLRMLAYRLTDRFAFCTTAVSEAAARRFIQRKAVMKAKCLVISNGIDTREMAPNGARRNETRVQMESEDHFIWLTAGRMVPAKDYPNLLRAFAKAHRIHAQTQLWIAAPEDGLEFRKCRDMAVQLGLEQAIRWLGLRRDMPALLDTADAFVLASAWEGMPLALAEAMAMEKPVVATDVGGVRELVGDAGVVVPPGNSVALAAAMCDLMQMQLQERQAMGRRARNRILELFSIETKAEEWETFYQFALEQAKGPERIAPAPR
jgi:glycosyltransferase involved in cell wall biosynthesis